MINENSVTYQYIGNVTNVGALDGSIDLLPEGAIALQRGDTHAIGANAGLQGVRMRAVQRLPGGQLVFSPYFTPNQGTVTRQNHVRPVEQVSYLGHNGTAGALDVEDDREYILNVTLNHTQGVYNNTPMIKSVPFYLRAYAAGTNNRIIQRDLAAGIVDNFKRHFARTPGNVVKAERVSDGVVAAQAAIATTILARVTEGSNIIEYMDWDFAGDVVPGLGTQVAGDALAIPIDGGRVFTFTTTADNHAVIIDNVYISVTDAGTADQNGTAVANAINNSVLSDRVIATNVDSAVTITYKPNFRSLPPVILQDEGAEACRIVTTTVGNNVRARYRMETAITNAASGVLDMPWQGPTGYIAINANPAQGTAPNSLGQTADATAADWGVMFSGRTPLRFNPVSETPFQVSFSLGFSKIMNRGDNGIQPALTDSRITYSVAANQGLGTFPQVAVKEVYTTMNEGNAQICGYPPTNYRKVATPGVEYDLFVVNATDAGYISATTGQRPISKFNIILAIDSTLRVAVGNVLNTQLTT